MNLDYLTLKYFVFPLGVAVDTGFVACANPGILYDLIPKPGGNVTESSVTVVDDLNLTLFLPSLRSLSNPVRTRELINHEPDGFRFDSDINGLQPGFGSGIVCSKPGSGFEFEETA